MVASSTDSDMVYMVPFIIGIIIVVPLTFEVIRSVLEDKLDFDVIINKSLLRAMELYIAVMIFPSAVVVLVLMVASYIAHELLFTASNIVHLLVSPKIVEVLVRFLVMILISLVLCVFFISVMKSVLMAIVFP